MTHLYDNVYSLIYPGWDYDDRKQCDPRYSSCYYQCYQPCCKSFNCQVEQAQILPITNPIIGGALIDNCGNCCQCDFENIYCPPKISSPRRYTNRGPPRAGCTCCK